MSEQTTAAVEPPATGNHTVDEALAALAGLDALPVGEHHQRLVAVQDLLAGVLDSSRGGAVSPIPEALRPKGPNHG